MTAAPSTPGAVDVARRADSERSGPAQGSGRRLLVVSPYPPIRDGIGAYALQQVRQLRRAGHEVEVLSPAPSAAHHHADLRGPAGAAALVRVGSGFDGVVLHLHPDVIYRLPPTAGARLATGTAYGLAFRRLRHVELRVHELDRRWADPSDPTSRATRFMLRGADAVTVHSDEQRRHLVEDFGLGPERVSLVDHGADFVPRTTADRARARAALGLPPDDHVFLCIGFVQPHKGFDRAARAFAGLPAGGARLDIVGSARVDDQATLDHVAELRAIAARHRGIHLHLGFISDEMFDRWIVACDTVVLPYRHIWSSSVAERAAMYGRGIIATRVGGLAHQVEDMPGAVLVDDNAGLARALAHAAGLHGGSGVAATAAWPVGPRSNPRSNPGSGPSDARGGAEVGEVDRTTIQAEIRTRAAASRGAVAPAPAAGAGSRDRTALSAPVRRLRPLQAPAPVSARPGVSVLKRLIHRVIGWELTPISDQVNSLQRATADALDRAQAASEGDSELESDPAPSPPTRPTDDTR